MMQCIFRTAESVMVTRHPDHIIAENVIGMFGQLYTRAHTVKHLIYTKMQYFGDEDKPFSFTQFLECFCFSECLD